MPTRFSALPFVCLVFAVSAVAQTATQTSFSISPSTVAEGGTTKLSVSVTASSGTPTGGVGIFVGTDKLLTIPLTNGSGTATVPVNGIAAGQYTVVAQYAGNANYGASQKSASATVLSPVTVALQAVPNPVVSGQTAKLVANLTATDGGGTPTGVVKFVAGPQTLGTATVSSGQAVLSSPTTGIPTGTYPVVAQYQGDSLHAAGNSATVDVTLEAAGGTACGTGSESLLSGQYTFSLSGWTGSSTPYFTAGAFIANGSGGISGGEQDFNFFHSTASTSISNVSAYSVGADGRGCLTLVTGNQVTHVYRFSLSNIGAQTAGTAFFGRMIEFDDKTGAGTRATGGFLQAYTSQFGLANLQPQYSFGTGGYVQSGSIESAELMGNFSVSTSGALSNGTTDSNFNGTTELNQSFSSGALSAFDAYGRATLSFTVQDQQFSYAVYEINRDHFYIIGNNSSGSIPVLDGEMHYAATGFTASTVYPTWVDHISGTSANQSGYEQVVARTTFNSNGTYSSARYQYQGGAGSSVTDSGTFTVSGNGRLVLNSSSGGTPQIYYMFYKADAFFVGSGAYVLGLQSPIATSGASDQQESSSYSDSSLAGAYNYGHDVMLEARVTDQCGATSISTAGALTGTIDESTSTGLAPATALSTPNAFNFGSTGISSAGGIVGIATGSNIYVLQENGSLNPILDLTKN